MDLASRIQAARWRIWRHRRIWCFEDHTAPSGCYEGAVKYGSADGVLWLDNSAENGGRSWLNPCSDTARKYVLDIVCDAVNFGADAVVLEGLRFPPIRAFSMPGSATKVLTGWRPSAALRSSRWRKGKNSPFRCWPHMTPPGSCLAPPPSTEAAGHAPGFRLCAGIGFCSLAGAAGLPARSPIRLCRRISRSHKRADRRARLRKG